MKLPQIACLSIYIEIGVSVRTWIQEKNSFMFSQVDAKSVFVAETKNV